MVPNSSAFANKIPRIDAEIQIFTELIATLSTSTTITTEQLADCVYLLTPKAATAVLPAGKIAGLSLMALTHGNEVGGVVVLNELLRGLIGGVMQCPLPIILALGNPGAAKRNQRFVDRDLNRSFLLASTDTSEARRADELEQILGKTAYLVDFHQTREISENPFFIFPYTSKGFAFAQAIAPQIPVVTHWGRPFSEDGRCSDEYVNSQGGVGITIEVGQNGYAPFSIGAGLWVAVQALRVAHAYLAQKPLIHDQQITPEIYTWLDILKYQDYGTDDISLLPGWRNFSHVRAGQQLGTAASKPIVTPAEAWLLFPQYPKPGDQRRPTELCRLMRRITPADLPS